MAVSGKRLLGIVITVFFTASSIVFIYEQYQKGKQHQPVRFTPEERRAYLYNTYKKELRSRINDSAILNRCCACLADTIVKRYTDEELRAIDKMPEQEQLRRVGDINDYCRKKSGLDSLLNSR